MIGSPSIQHHYLDSATGHFYDPNGRSAAENIKQAFTELEQAMKDKMVFFDLDSVSKQWFQRLFATKSSNCLLFVAAQDTRSQLSLSLQEIPVGFSQFLPKKKAGSDQISASVCLLEYFILKWLGLIRRYATNEVWQDLFLGGLNAMFNLLMSIDRQWTYRFFKYFELAFIAELPAYVSAASESAPGKSSSDILCFSYEYVLFYKFYTESYLFALKEEFEESKESFKDNPNYRYLSDFMHSFMIVFESLFSLANCFSVVDFQGITDLLNSFLITENDEFKEFFVKEKSVEISIILGQYLVLASESVIYKESMLSQFELIISYLGQSDKGNYKKYLNQKVFVDLSSKSLVFQVYYNSVFPELFKHLLPSYKVVAKALGEYSEELNDKLATKIELGIQAEIEFEKQQSKREPEVELTPSDWNYPFEVPGEWKILFMFALKLGHFIDWLRGRKQIPEPFKPRMWLFKNGKKMFIDNPWVSSLPIPVTKVRWLAKHGFLLTALIIACLISLILKKK